MVIDTNIFIEHLRAKDKSKTSLYNLNTDISLFISVITLYELLIGATTPEKLNDISIITTGIIIIPLDESISRNLLCA